LRPSALVEEIAVADQMTDLDTKQIMLSIAEGYEHLTRHGEARKKNSD
jgi:hypothetical protein